MTLSTTELDPHLRLRGRPACGSRLDCDLSAFTLPEFRAGLLAATATLGLGIVLVLVLRRRQRSSPPALIGPLLLLGAAVAYWGVDRLLPWVAMCVALLAAGGYLAARFGAGLPTSVLAAAPGGVLLAATPALDGLVPAWCRVGLGSATVLGAALAAVMDREHAGEGLAPVCLAVSVVAVYETVPDTDLVLVLLPLALLLSLLAWPAPLARIGAAGTYGFVGLLFFTVVVGGRGRLSAVVGGLACLGLLALEPAARRLAGGRSLLDRLPRTAASAASVGAVQLLVVFLSTRLAGTRLTVPAAVAVALPVTLLVLAALAAGARQSRAPSVVRG
jgi:hypothetical protein